MFNIYLKDDDFAEPDEPVYFLLAQNGLFLIKNSLFFKSSGLFFGKLTGEKEEKTLPWLKEHKEGVKLTLPSKIPGSLIQQTLNFFRAVNKAYKGAEAIVLIYWLPKEKKYEFFAPEQEVGQGILPYYKVGVTPDGKIRVGTIHSHANTEASHSPTDDRDEAYDEGFHITIGNVDFAPSFSCSIVCGGMRYIVEPEKLIETKAENDFPKGWLKKVRRGYARQPRVYVAPPPAPLLNTPPYRGYYDGPDIVRNWPQTTHQPPSETRLLRTGEAGEEDYL